MIGDKISTLLSLEDMSTISGISKVGEMSYVSGKCKLQNDDSLSLKGVLLKLKLVLSLFISKEGLEGEENISFESHIRWLIGHSIPEKAGSPAAHD